MIILTDNHHSGLYSSLKLLFENRLGYKLYRPTGMEWYHQGYWKVYDHPDTAHQYLAEPFDDGLTLENFFKLPVQVVIASIPEHIQPFKRLTEAHSLNPKLIFQVGNAFSIEDPTIKNVMASAKVERIPDGIHLVQYHQEFSLDVFHYGEPHRKKNIYSFVNCFNTGDIFKKDWELFLEMEKLMPNWNFKCFGGQGRDGGIVGDVAVADKERESMFIWHTKWGGDGYGHIVFNAAAVGRPLIVKKEYYKNKLGEKLMIDGITCITIDGLGLEEIKNKIEYYSDPTLYTRMSLATFDTFKREVNFNLEQVKIESFLAHLL